MPPGGTADASPPSAGEGGCDRRGARSGGGVGRGGGGRGGASPWSRAMAGGGGVGRGNTRVGTVSGRVAGEVPKSGFFSFFSFSLERPQNLSLWGARVAPMAMATPPWTAGVDAVRGRLVRRVPDAPSTPPGCGVRVPFRGRGTSEILPCLSLPVWALCQRVRPYGASRPGTSSSPSCWY